MSTVRQNWLEQVLPDGRKYWYNMNSGHTVWEEPTELSTTAVPSASTSTSPAPSISLTTAPMKKATATVGSDIAASWREMTAANGRKYYYNAATKVSMWTVPPEYAAYLERIKDPARLDKEALEEKFMAMLKEKNITSRYSWEEALREVINHPHYKLVPTLAERKALFARHIELQREVEREERHQRLLRDQEAFKALIRSTPEITGTMRYREALELLSEQAAFQALAEDDRIRIFDEVITDIWREEAEARRQRKRRAAEKFTQLLNSLQLTVETPWQEAQVRWRGALASDPDYSEWGQLDQLTAFETYIRDLEAREEEASEQRRKEQRRRERHARAAFGRLLGELERTGQVTAQTSWKQLYSILRHRTEYQSLLAAQSGSTPLDLFWDRLDVLQDAYVQEMQPIIKKLQSTLGNDYTRWGEEGDKELPASLRSHLFPLAPALSGSLAREAIRAKVEVYRREYRRAIDQLKHAIKHFTPPITLNTTYESIAEAMGKIPEIVAVAEEDIRRYYFDKYIRHLRKRAGLEVDKSDDDQ